MRHAKRPTGGLSFGSVAFVCIFFVGSQSLSAQESVSPRSEQAVKMTARVDELLDAKLKEIGWEPAPTCDDASLLRRAYLDLTGMAPQANEVIEFTESSKAGKRSDLFDRLLASPQSASHFASTWSNWLLPEANAPEVQLGRSGLEVWLRNRFAENLRYDRLVADLLVSSGTIQNSPTAFFVALENKPEKIAAKTARVFLGLQLDCAECHNHPFDKWKQDDFWGFAAYFSRLSSNNEQMLNPNAQIVDADEGEVTLPGTEQVVAPKPLVDTGFSGLASGTRRQQLTLWLTAPENPFLARAAVNRAWSMLFGRGLIEPIDDMRSLEMATHPELLGELSNYFAETGYDLRKLISVLVNTRAYQRSTRHSSGQVPDASYAVMATKPLTEKQLTACVSQVARQIVGDQNPGAAAMQQQLTTQLGKLRGEGSQATLGIVQALVTLHGTAFDAVSRDSSSRLLQALTAPHMDDQKRVQWLFLSTLNRKANAEEIAAFSSLIEQQAKPAGDGDKKPPLWQSDLLWALINSTEFAMTP